LDHRPGTGVSWNTTFPAREENTVRALIATGQRDPAVALAETGTPRPRPDEALVKVAASPRKEPP
jgi:hypothetical protein